MPFIVLKIMYNLVFMKSFCLHITADVSKTQMRQTEHYLYYECSVIIRLSLFFQKFLLFGMLLVLKRCYQFHKNAIITRTRLWLKQSLQSFDTAFIIKKNFMVHFKNAFQHENQAFPNGTSFNEILFLIVLHIRRPKYSDVNVSEKFHYYIS